MRRVCEGPLGESQLRGALTHLLDGLATVDFKKRHSRSLPFSFRTTPKNLHLRHSCEPIAVASGTTEHGRQYRRPIGVLRDPHTSYTYGAQRADYGAHDLLPRRADEFIRETEAFDFGQICRRKGEAIR